MTQCDRSNFHPYLTNQSIHHRFASKIWSILINKSTFEFGYLWIAGIFLKSLIKCRPNIEFDVYELFRWRLLFIFRDHSNWLNTCTALANSGPPIHPVSSIHLIFYEEAKKPHTQTYAYTFKIESMEQNNQRWFGFIMFQSRAPFPGIHINSYLKNEPNHSFI